MNIRETVTGSGLVTVLAWLTFRILLRKHSMETLQEASRRADIRYVLMGCLCTAVFINCKAANTRLLMRTLRRTVPFRRSLSYACAGFYLSAIAPSATGGQSMHLYYMTKDSFGFAQSFFTFLTVAAMYQMSMLLCGTAVVIVRFLFVTAQSGVIRWPLIFGVLINGICSYVIPFTILDGLLVERASTCIVDFLTRVGVIRNKKKAQCRMEGLIMKYSRDGTYLREYPLVTLRMFPCSMARLTAPFPVPYFACLVLGIDAEPGSFPAMQAILSLVVTAVPLPGSAGALEGSLTALYGPLFGVDRTFSIMMFSRGISLYGFLVVNGLVTAYLQFRPRLRAIGKEKRQVIGVDIDR